MHCRTTRLINFLKRNLSRLTLYPGRPLSIHAPTTTRRGNHLHEAFPHLGKIQWGWGRYSQREGGGGGGWENLTPDGARSAHFLCHAYWAGGGGGGSPGHLRCTRDRSCARTVVDPQAGISNLYKIYIMYRNEPLASASLAAIIPRLPCIPPPLG